MITYTTISLEILSFTTAIIYGYLLAHKNRHAWGIYILFSVITIILFTIKDSYITVINQTCLGVTAFYQWIYWSSKEHSFQKYLTIACWGIFLYTLTLFKFDDIGSWFEIGGWFFIHLNHTFTRQKDATGWLFMVAQKILNIAFNIARMNYILAVRNTIQLGQAIYGYRKWKKPPDILKTSI